MDENAKKIIDEAKLAIGGNQKVKAVSLLSNLLENYGEDINVCNIARYYLAYAEETASKCFDNIKRARKAFPGDKGVLNKFIELKEAVFVDAKNAISSNDKLKARQLLTSIIEVEGDNEQVWLLLLDVLETVEERVKCLEIIVRINPNNNEALKLLESLRRAPEPPKQNNELETMNISSKPMDENERRNPPSLNSEKRISRWDEPFRTEKDICDNFEEYVDKLLIIAKEMSPEPKKQIRSIIFSKDAKNSKWKEGMRANVFLAPSVNAAADISEKLLEAEKFQNAFWVSNCFGEMAKILLERSMDRYRDPFEQLVFVACCAAGIENKYLDRSRSEADSEELKLLQKQIERIALERAFGSYFNNKRGCFLYKRAWAESNRAKQILYDSLAWCFDKHLYYLLKYDRPQVNGFAWRNLPIIFQLKLSDKWSKRRKSWTELLNKEGYEDLIRDLKGMDVLINPDEVGKISPEQLEDIRRAERNNNFKEIKNLLKENINDLRDLLYRHTQKNLIYLKPHLPKLRDSKLRKRFEKVPALSHAGSSHNYNKAIEITKNVWEEEIDNLDLQNWLGYLYAKSDSIGSAERALEAVRNRGGNGKKKFVTDWNLAVLAFERKDERQAYNYLLPLVNNDKSDLKLVKILLTLSHKLGDKKQFLSLVPKTLTNQFLPLAFVMAYELEDEELQKVIIVKITNMSNNWRLPPVDNDIKSSASFKKTVNRAIVEGQVDQLIQWLKIHIKKKPRFLIPYIELAKVLEGDRKDIDGAFDILIQRVKRQKEVKKADKKYIEEACRDLLDLCKRNKRTDLGQKAYAIVKKQKINPDILTAFKDYAPELPEIKEEVVQKKAEVKSDFHPYPLPESPVDPELPERLAWVTAQLTKVQTIEAYIREKQVIKEFVKILGEMNPQDSELVVDLITNITETIDSFGRNESNDMRRILYDKAAGYEKRLTDLLRDFETNHMLKRLSNVLTPFLVTLKRVMGDLSKQAGITPKIKSEVENTFISLENVHSTLVLRITNESERRVTDIVVNMSSESPIVSIIKESEQKIASLEPFGSKLLNFPIERKDSTVDNVNDIVFSAWLRASSESFKDIDMGINKLKIPVKTFPQVIKEGLIIKFFQVGQSLKPTGSNRNLFKGRDDLLNKIKGSFQGGVQNERYFLDGIRRVGKTSIINFLPNYLPDNTIPVFIEFDLQSRGIRGKINSADVLHNFCNQIMKKTLDSNNVKLPLLELDNFNRDPGQAFQNFLASFKQMLPNKTPLLMIDEFQDLLHAISKTGKGEEQDTLVLDQLRGLMDQGQLYMISTGSIRFDRLSSIVQHRIFGSLTRLPISFLSEENVGNVLRAGFDSPVKIPQETIKEISSLTGGYPWLVQAYGSALVDLLNDERRIIATPTDVKYITEHIMLTNSQNFEFWWPVEQLGIDEEKFMEHLFRKYSDKDTVPIRDFFREIRAQEQGAYMKAFQNLRAWEVLDSNQPSVLKIRGNILKQWLLTQMQTDNRLKIRVHQKETPVEQGKIGIFVDHENLVLSLERISRARGINVPDGQGKVEWLSGVLKRLLEEAKRRAGEIDYKVTVAFWNRPYEAQLISAYFITGFSPQQPESTKIENAVDFKLVDEVRRYQQQASLEKSRLEKVIIVSGDGDYAHMVRTLVHEGVDVQIWGGSHATSSSYEEMVGGNNVVAIDDICGF